MCESYVKKALIFVFDSSKCCIVEKRYIRRSSVSQSLRPCEKSYLGHELRHIDRDVSKGMLSETVLGGKSVDAVSTVQTSKGAANR